MAPLDLGHDHRSASRRCPAPGGRRFHRATLSFLGVGLPTTEPSLGLLISNGFDYLLSGEYWISFYPGIALLVTIMSINLMGDQVRGVLNPRLQR